WDGPGTVRVVISGPNNTVVNNLAKIEEVRRYIAGDIAVLDPAVPIPTATVNTSAGTLPDGTYSYVYSYVNESGGETLPSPAVTATTSTGSSQVTLTGIPT